MHAQRWLAVAVLLPVLGGCGSTSEPDPAPETAPAPAPTSEPAALVPGEAITIDVDDRPFRLYAPESFDPAVTVPLVLLLHGYTSNSVQAEAYFQLAGEADLRSFLYALPEGTTNPSGDQFWNATEACCDFHRTGVDDVAYLRGIIEELTSGYPVDPARVYLVGHSNGGFMAHRMACEHAGLVAGIVSLAGMAPNDEAGCAPAEPVGVLQIHGTADPTIPYQGGANGNRPFPSATETVQRWRDYNGCTGEADDAAGPLDLDAEVAGAETTITSSAGCRDGARVELWSIQDGDHVPRLTERFPPAVLDFLYSL